MTRISSASLSIYSDTHKASDVSAIMGLEPSTLWEKGDRRIDTKREREYKPRTQSGWHFDADSSLNDPADDSGFAALRVLLTDLANKSAALGSLRPHYRTVIRWIGETGTTQGNFAMDADLIVAMGALGCEFWGTIIEDDPDEA